MKSLLNIVFNVIGLLLFAMLVMGGADVFDMIFSLAGGDFIVLSFATCGFIVLFVGGCWLWSARNRCQNNDRGGRAQDTHGDKAM